MLNQTFAYSIAKCDNCEKWIIYKSVEGLPNVCPRCGVPANRSLTIEEIRQIKNIQDQQERMNAIHNHGTTFRRG
jgi:Zn finger protein HypA/HybF involved in hydrogenase expression